MVGAGEVGYHIADILSREEHRVTVIEHDPGLAAVGPYECYGFLPANSKLLLGLLMLFGRLEFAAM